MTQTATTNNSMASNWFMAYLRRSTRNDLVGRRRMRGPPIRTGRLHRQIRRAFIASNDAPSAAGGLRFDLGILELKSPGICAGLQKEPSHDRPRA